jgi:hypothetical protein
VPLLTPDKYTCSYLYTHIFRIYFMADPAPISYEQMRDLLRDHAASIRSPNTGGSSSAPPPPTGGGGGSVLPSNASVQSFGVGLLEAFNKLQKGSLSAADGLGLVTGALEKIPGVGKLAAAGVSMIGQEGIAGQKAIQRGADTGVTLSGDIGALKELAGRSRLTQDEFIQKMGAMGPKMNGLGATMDEAAKNTGKVSEEFIQSPMGRQLKEMGLSYDELNNITMQYLSSRKFSDLSDAKQRKQVNEELQQFAQNLAENSRVTGVSTQQQAKNVEGAVASGMIQAKILQMGPEGESSYRKMRGSLEGMGDEVTKFADEIFTGGIRTKEGTERMAALGPAGRELEAAINMSKNAKNAEQRAAADAAMAAAQQRVSEHMRSKQFTDTVLYQQNSLGQTAQRMLEQNRRVGSQMAGERAAMAQGLKPQQGAEVQRQMAAAGAQGRDPRTGAALPGAEAFKTMQAGETRLKDEAAGLSTQFNKLNTELGKSLQNWGVLNSKILQPRTTEGAGISGAINKVTGRDKGPRETSGEMLSRETGSLGSVGKLIEDFGKGTPAMLHGREGVITEKQLNDLLQSASSTKNVASDLKINDLMKTAMPKQNLGSDIQSKMSGMMQDIQAKIAQPPKELTPAPAVTTAETASSTSATSTEQPVMTDIKDLLNQLNTTMKEMLAKSTDMVDMSSQQIRVTKKLSGNRFG